MENLKVLEFISTLMELGMKEIGEKGRSMEKE